MISNLKILFVWLIVISLGDNLYAMSVVKANKDLDRNLSRGVNINFTVTEENGHLTHVNDLINQITEEDVLRIKSIGMTHVRLALSPYPLMQDGLFRNEKWRGKNATLFLASVHRIIRLFANHRILVVLAVMPNEESFRRLYRNPKETDAWEAFFRAWGKEFSIYSPSQLLFETLNEPRFVLFLAKELHVATDEDHRYPPLLLQQANARWIPIESRLLLALRSSLPQHTLIATSDGFSDPIALTLRTPIEDSNIIYTFHYYMPLLFTHQSATWFEFPGSHISGLTYPSKEANCKSANLPIKDLVTLHYCVSGWNIERHRKYMSKVQNWSRRHRVTVWLGEFGAYLKAIDAESRRNYYQDIRTVAEENSFGWCAWEYVGWLGRFLELQTNSALSYHVETSY
ncbi:MAG: cellulase family glycosylhydrolase [Pirellulales bacterium]